MVRDLWEVPGGFVRLRYLQVEVNQELEIGRAVGQGVVELKQQPLPGALLEKLAA